MRITRSKLRQIIAEELGHKITERKSRETVEAPAAPRAGEASIKREVIPMSTLQAMHEDRVETEQSHTAAAGSSWDPDFFGLSDVDKLHDLAEALSSAEILGLNGQMTFTPWQSWSQAGRGSDENSIDWTLINNVSGHDGVPDSRAFILSPSVIGLKTEEEVQEEQSSSALSDYHAALDTMHSAAKGAGTTQPDFDQGFNAALAAYRSDPDNLAGVADPYIKAKGTWDSVVDMITGEFSFGAETTRVDSWNDNKDLQISESSSMGVSPEEVWNWERAGLGMLLEQSTAPQVAEVDVSNLGSAGMELYIERVEEILSDYPNIGWGHTTEVDLPTFGGTKVPGIVYFFSKSSLADADDLKRSGTEALRKIAAAKKRDDPADREALERIAADALSTRGVSSSSDEESSESSAETTSESIVRSVIRQQLMIERKKRSHASTQKKNNLIFDILLAERRERTQSSEEQEESESSEAQSSDDEIESGGGDVGSNIELIKSEMTDQGITDKRLRLAILGVIGKESGFMPQSEKGYGNTSNSRIVQIFGDRVSSENLPDGKTLDQLKADDEAFFNHVYGPEFYSKYRNTEPGDGYKYRGRGFNQVTFKSNYEKYGLGGDPESLNDPAVAARVAVEFLGNSLDRLEGRDHEYDDINDAVDDAAQANAGLGKRGSALSRAVNTTKAAIRKHFSNEPEVSEIS